MSAAALLALVLIAPAFLEAAPTQTQTITPPTSHPPDPLADEYLPLPPRGYGAAPGQLRFIALGGGGYYRDGHIAGQGTIETIALPNLGLRGSLEASVPFGLTDAQLFSARIGPAFHLLPYRRVDLGVFVEAGGATVDIFRARRTGMFAFTPGVTFDVALGAYWAMRLEAQLQAGTADRDGHADLVLVPMFLFGFGPVL
jgi:hypothetical protein